MSARLTRSLHAGAVAGLALLLAACGGGRAPATPTPAPVAADEHIVLVRDHGLVLHADGGGERTLLTTTEPNVFPAYPAWSPDGTTVAYARAVFEVGTGVDWGDDVYVLTPGAGAPRLVRKHADAGQQVHGIAWMPDGHSLLIGYRQTLITDGRFAGIHEEIDRVDVATGEATPFAADATEPSVARDGSLVAYLHGPSTGVLGLWVAALDGSGARQIALPDAESVPFAPRIAPDGSAIAFSAPALAPAPAPAPTSTPTPAAGVAPAREPLARLLALLPFAPRPAAAHGIPMDVWRVDLADGRVTQLTHFAGDDPRTAWSSDGAFIDVITTGGLYRLARDGSGFVQIGDGAFQGELDAR